MVPIPAASHPSEEQLQHPVPEWVLLLPLEKSLAGSPGEITYQQMTSHFHLLPSCGTHEQRARAGARASRLTLTRFGGVQAHGNALTCYSDTRGLTSPREECSRCS